MTEKNTDTQTDVQPEAGKKQSVAKSTGMMSALILLSRVTGFIRTWAMAFALGNTYLASAYSLANNLPNMIYELVAGGVLSTAFLPIYLQVRNSSSRDDANRYASNLLSLVLVVLGAVSVLASIFAPQVMVTQTLFNSSSNQTVNSAVWLFRFFSFQILFYGISAVFSGLLNAERHYFWSNINSVFMNLVTITTFFGYPFVSQMGEDVGLTWLAVGTTLSIAVLAFVQLPALIKHGFKFTFFIDLHSPALHDTLKLALPAIATTAINLVTLSLMNSCALNVADNGPSSVSYAWMWYQFPYGVLGVALSTALFTEMSDALSHNDVEGFKRNLRFGYRTTWILIVPMAAMLWICADELIGLYAAGKFTADDIRPIAALLRGWAIALPFYASYMFVYRAYSSLKNLKTVAVCNLVLSCVQILCYVTFTGVIADGAFSLGLVGLAVGDTVFYLLMNVVLLVILRKRIGAFGFRSLVAPIAKVIVASVVGAGVAYLVTIPLTTAVDTTHTLGALLALIVTGVIGLGLIYMICRLLHVEEVVNFAAALKRRLLHR
jgi:putative peptidoglycan lipid II flippase